MGHAFSQVGPQCQPCRGTRADTPGLKSVPAFSRAPVSLLRLTEACSPATDRDRRSSPSSSYPGVTQTKNANKAPLQVGPSERDLEGGGRDGRGSTGRDGCSPPQPPQLPACREAHG